MLVSTFELLVKPQLPKELEPSLSPTVKKLSRTVIQGYFLTLANPSNSRLNLSLVFTAITPALNSSTSATFLDINGINNTNSSDLDPAANRARFELTLPPRDTGLFILQPDIVKDNGALVRAADFEVRGFVEVFLQRTASNPNVTEILLTPEQRGTFFNSQLLEDSNAEPRLDQIIYNLPTATGSSLFTLRKSALPFEMATADSAN
jgi:hypothetical protein